MFVNPNVTLRAALLALACVTVTAGAQAPGGGYPVKPIRLIVPYVAGGPSDLFARAVGQLLTEAWGQPVVIDNRPGASGNVGVLASVRSPADGYTLNTVSIAFAVSPAMDSKLGYDPVKDLAPVSLLASINNILVVHPTVPVKSVKELIAFAAARPGQVTFASGGAGGAQHLAGELFSNLANVKMTHIPYKGSGPAMADLLGGHVKLMMDSTASALGPIVDKRIKALGVTTSRRAPPPLDTIPPIADTIPGFDAAGWSGLAAPARTPLEVVARVNKDVNALLQDAAIVRQIEQRAAMPAPGSPIQFAEFIKTEMDTWGAVVRATGTKPGT